MHDGPVHPEPVVMLPYTLNDLSEIPPHASIIATRPPVLWSDSHERLFGKMLEILVNRMQPLGHLVLFLEPGASPERYVRAVVSVPTLIPGNSVYGFDHHGEHTHIVLDARRNPAIRPGEPPVTKFRALMRDRVARHRPALTPDLVLEAIAPRMVRGHVLFDPFAYDGLLPVVASELGMLGAAMELDPDAEQPSSPRPEAGQPSSDLN